MSGREKLISGLDPANSFTGLELLPMSQAGATVKATANDLKDFISQELLSSSYVSTMRTTNTALQNLTAFVTDLTAVALSGKTLFIPGEGFIIGGGELTYAAGLNDKITIRGVPGKSRLIIDKSSTAIPLTISTQSLWQDLDITAIDNDTFVGGDMSNLDQLTKVTVSGTIPMIKVGDMVSIYSQDMLLYSTTPYELNYNHEMSEVLQVVGQDIYLARKLKRTYNLSNSPKLRIYNNRNVLLDIDDLWFDTTGDTYDNTVLSTVRPIAAMEVRGLRDVRVGKGVHFKSAWAATFRFNSTAYTKWYASADNLVNGTSAGAALGYNPAFDGPNFMPMIDGIDTHRGRHQPTSVWTEESKLILNNTSFQAGASTTRFGYTLTPGPNNTPAVGDRLYINVSGVSGTINTMPIGWYVVTARSSTTVTVSYASTGLTFTSGTGGAELFKPTEVHRYGEMEGLRLHNMRGSFTHGAMFDSHENTLGTRITDCENRFSSGFSWSSTAGRSINERGANLTVDGFFQEGYAGFADIASFGANHGVTKYTKVSAIRTGKP